MSPHPSRMLYVSLKDFEAVICLAGCHLSSFSCLLCSLLTRSFFCLTVILGILCWLLLYLVSTDARPPGPVLPHTPLRTAMVHLEARVHDRVSSPGPRPPCRPGSICYVQGARRCQIVLLAKGFPWHT